MLTRSKRRKRSVDGLFGAEDLHASVAEFLGAKELLCSWTVVSHQWNNMLRRNPWCFHSFEALRMSDIYALPLFAQQHVRKLRILFNKWLSGPIIFPKTLLIPYVACTDLEMMCGCVGWSRYMKSVKRIIIHAPLRVRHDVSVPAPTVESVTMHRYFTFSRGEAEVVLKHWLPHVRQFRLYGAPCSYGVSKSLYINISCNSEPIPLSIQQSLQQGFESFEYKHR